MPADLTNHTAGTARPTSNRETQIPVDKTFAAGGNESELIENETTYGGVSGIFRNCDVVLGFEIADI